VQAFTLGRDNSDSAWTFVTAAFSHVELTHLLGSLVPFWIFSNMLLAAGIGPFDYWFLVMGSAIWGNFAFLLHNRKYESIVRRILGTCTRGTGLSGVIMGLAVVISLSAPTARISVGVFRIPVYLVVILCLAVAPTSLEHPQLGPGQVMRLGGAMYGALFCLLRPRNVALPFAEQLET